MSTQRWGGDRIGPFHYGESTRLAAEIIHRHRHPMLRADIRNQGKYAVYFYEYPDGDTRRTEHFRSVGGFPSVADAARAVPYIVAETIIEDVAVWEADSVEHGE